jgi:hypothetical protein
MLSAAFRKNRPPGSELDDLSEKYYGSEGCRKHISYLAEYERFLSPIRYQPIRLLELGVRFGASMQMWRDYLPRATIVGIDLDNCPEAFPNDDRVRFLHGGQDDPAILDEALRRAGGPFDLIIDDCAHIGHIAARSFAHLFPKSLRSGGMYVIEDICTAFLVDFPQFAAEAERFSPPPIGLPGQHALFKSHQNGLIGLVKQISDHVMSGLAQGQLGEFPIESLLIKSNIAFVRKL